MNIIHVVRQFHPSVGGLEDYVENLAHEQLSAGHEVQVFTLDSDFQTGETLVAREVCKGIQVRRFAWKGSQRYPVCSLDLKALDGADIVHVHAIDFIVDYLSLMKRLGRFASKLVVSTHGGFFHTSKNQRIKQLFFQSVTRFTLSGADAILSCSDNDHALFQQIAPRTQLVKNGTRLHKFGPVQATSRTNDMVYLGRFSSNKRLPWLIEAYAALSCPMGILKIIGRSKTGDAEALSALISRLGCGDRVTLVLDQTDEQIRQHLTTARYTVSASEYEGFGLGVVEMMSYGLLPFLADQPPSFIDFVRGAGCGRLFAHDVQAFEQAYLLLTHGWSETAAVRAQTYAEQFSWPAVAKDIMAVYQGTLESDIDGTSEGAI